MNFDEVYKRACAGGTEKNKENFSPFLKILIAAVLLVVIALPVYRYAIHERLSDTVQTLELMPARAGGSDVIYLKKGGDVDISFFVNPPFQEHADIVITGDFSLQQYFLSSPVVCHAV